MVAKNAPSARGLFNATGKTSKPVNVRHDDGTYGKAKARDRSKDDFDPTPPEPIEALLHYERGRLADFETIWDPSAGDGALVRPMEAAGFKVIASDLVDRGAGYEIKSLYDIDRAPARASIQNPPFSECSWGHGKVRWQKHLLDTLGLDYLALLLPWQWPGAANLGPFWERRPPARVYLMRWRIDFTGMGASPMLNAWWIWDTAYEGETLLRMMDPVDGRQQNLFADEVV